MGTHSFYLFAKPSFLEGISRVLDLGNTLQDYNKSKGENDADYNAMKRDWQAVGKDIYDSINKYEQTQKGKATTSAASGTK